MRSRTFDLRAHLVEQRRQVDNLRLARAILKNGFALGQSSGHQEVFSSGDRDFLEDYPRAFQPLGAGLDVAMLLRDLGSEFLQPFDVQIDGARADGTAARQ